MSNQQNSGNEPNQPPKNQSGDLVEEATRALNDAVESATQLGEAAATAAQQFLEQATTGAGQVLTFVAQNPLLKFITKVLGVDRFLGLLTQVDVEKAQAAVKQLQQQYPQEAPREIAHRIMVEKSLQAGGIGLVTNIIPPIALALFAIDLVAIARLQAEMVYQIAVVYGLDLQDSTRQGEVLAIFGLSLGGSGVLKTGSSVVEILPGIGPVVGASTNAIMLYALGYAACRFYEGKVGFASEPVTADAIQRESDAYLQRAVAQQQIMDRVLVHMILASYPETSRSDILPELQQLHFSPQSLDTVAANLQSPQPLDSLLDRLDPDLATPLLARCYKIAQLDGEISPQEQAILNAIAEKFSLDLNAIATTLEAQSTERESP